MWWRKLGCVQVGDLKQAILLSDHISNLLFFNIITAFIKAEPKVLKNSWKLRSDQDGGSGGHLLGQGWVQVREKATGDLLLFVFVKFPLSFHFFIFVKAKVF